MFIGIGIGTAAAAFLGSLRRKIPSFRFNDKFNSQYLARRR